MIINEVFYLYEEFPTIFFKEKSVKYVHNTIG